MNKITKGVFELGSIFKTFTVALALEEENIVDQNTLLIILKKILNVLCIRFLISNNFLNYVSRGYINSIFQYRNS